MKYLMILDGIRKRYKGVLLMAKCPICKARLGTKNIIVGNLGRKVCPICGAKLRINKWHMFIIVFVTMMINFCINRIITYKFSIEYIMPVLRCRAVRDINSQRQRRDD